MHSFLVFYEPVSSLTHLIGALAFVCMGFALMRRSRRHPRRRFMLVYSLTCVLQLAISGVYHSLAEGTARNMMLRLDLAAIFLLIAGTFTAVHGSLLTGKKHWGVVYFVWGIGFAGVILSTAFYDLVPSGFWLAMYLLQGWSGVISAWIIWRQHGLSYTVLPFCGGVVFSIGGVIEAAEQMVVIPYIVAAHEVFHLAVLLGMSCFWIFIFDALRIEQPARHSTARNLKPHRAPAGSPLPAMADETAS